MTNYAEDVCGNWRDKKTLNGHLANWIFGLALPGKWMSFKIMTALAPLHAFDYRTTGIAQYYECGLILQKYSYWRVRTVLGRVLGSSPGAISLCRWTGPCPAFELTQLLP